MISHHHVDSQEGVKLWYGNVWSCLHALCYVQIGLVQYALSNLLIKECQEVITRVVTISKMVFDRPYKVEISNTLGSENY